MPSRSSAAAAAENLFTAELRARALREAMAGGLTLYFYADEALRPLPGPIEAACFDLVQEAIVNVVRHAKATRVWVRLGLARDDLLVTVRDDGAGFDPDSAQRRALSGDHVGLPTLYDRINAMGGSLEVRSAPHEGTTLAASFPLGPLDLTEPAG
jgi:two-component system sensor histidine kinase UhpB